MTETNPHVLIVGSRGSIGKAITERLSDSGYTVIGFEGDATDSASVQEFINKQDVKIDHIIYSASAPLTLKTIDKEEVDDFRRQYEVSVIGLLNIVQSALKDHSLQSLLIIGSSSTLGEMPARLASYVTAKYAQVGLMKSLASELKSRSIRVNMVSPGLTGEGASKDFPEAIKEFTRQNTSDGKLVTPQDVAGKVAEIIAGKGSGENVLLSNVQ